MMVLRRSVIRCWNGVYTHVLTSSRCSNRVRTIYTTAISDVESFISTRGYHSILSAKHRQQQQQQQQHRQISLYVSSSFRRLYTSMAGGDGDNGGDNSSTSPQIDSNDGVHVSLRIVPEEYPQLPAIAVHKGPLFPHKGYPLHISKTEPHGRALIDFLKRRLQAEEPYVGVFLRRDSVKRVDLVCDSMSLPTSESSSVKSSTAADINATGLKDEEVVSKKNLLDHIEKVGVFASVNRIQEIDDETVAIVIEPRRRIRANCIIPWSDASGVARAGCYECDDSDVKGNINMNIESETSLLKGLDTDSHNQYCPAVLAVVNLQDEPYDADDDIVKATKHLLLSELRETMIKDGMFREAIMATEGRLNQEAVENVGSLADFVAVTTFMADPTEHQEILEELDPHERMKKALRLIKKHQVSLELQEEISKKVQETITKSNRRHILQEQLRTIRKELGEGKDDGGKDSIIDKFSARLKGKTISPSVQEIIDEEMNKFRQLEPISSEFSVTRNYLDWLTVLPWSMHTTDNLDVDNAAKVLEEDHYGMNDVKERILEFIAVGQLKGSVQGKIMCLVGPPGVGKTTVASSIARSLNRTFFRFSVGGMHDVAEIKGHRRTYVGAMPGKVIQGLKKAGSANPLILIDEIDKLGSGHGDPASALLEMLDPDQNVDFMDHYLDVPVDLSKVLFLCTANTMSNAIPAALRDRMEIIEVNGYVPMEKRSIAERYLLPALRNSTGVTEEQVCIEDSVIDDLNHRYCRESGVRNLQKHIEKILRKAALKITRITTPNSVTSDEGSKSEASVAKMLLPLHVSGGVDGNLSEYVGPPVFLRERLYEVPHIGVSFGLAHTGLGGKVLAVESVIVDRHGGGRLQKATGMLGSSMSESTQVAYSFSRAFIDERYPNNKFFSNASVALHFPAGAQKKDGPSAGLAITASLLSLALNVPMRADTSMTGELSLHGRVMPIGGLQEKLLASQRAGIRRVILPEENRKDYLELNESVRDNMDIHFVDDFSGAFPLLFDVDAVPPPQFTHHHFDTTNKYADDHGDDSDDDSVETNVINDRSAPRNHRLWSHIH